MFKNDMEFKVVEICENGVVITHYLKGKKHKVRADIVKFKHDAKKYEMFGDGMVVWS